ncbi:hypothetical protein ACFX19_043373 [Malus domestica]
MIGATKYGDSESKPHASKGPRFESQASRGPNPRHLGSGDGVHVPHVEVLGHLGDRVVSSTPDLRVES